MTLHDANLVLSIFFGPFLMDSIMKMHLILIYRHVIFLGGVTTQMFLGWGQPLSAFYLLSIPIQGFIFICFSRKTRTFLIVLILIDTVTLYPFYRIYISKVSHYLALLHLIPSWLIWAEIECTVHFPLPKQPINQFKPV